MKKKSIKNKEFRLLNKVDNLKFLSDRNFKLSTLYKKLSDIGISSELSGQYIQLNLSDVIPTIPALELLTKLLLEHKNIKKLDFSKSKNDDVTLGALVEQGGLKYIISLNLHSNNIDEFFLKDLLRVYPQIEKLDISLNEIGNFGVSILLGERILLISLNLSGNEINATGAKCIATALIEEKLPLLEILNLGHNSLESQGLSSLLGALIGNKSLKDITLSDNNILVIDSLITFLHQGKSSLKYIDLGNNHIKSSNILEIIKAYITNPFHKYLKMNFTGSPCDDKDQDDRTNYEEISILLNQSQEYIDFNGHHHRNPDIPFLTGSLLYEGISAELDMTSLFIGEKILTNVDVVGNSMDDQI